jgi:two-component system, OmpR family, response regulator
MHILVIEDERRFARLLAHRLEETGHQASLAFDGPEGLAKVTTAAPDVAIVDVMLPGIDGVALTRSLRREGSQVPILMLTARDAVDDRVAALDAGADDYLVKPFAFSELLARIQAITRSGERDHLSHGPLEVNVRAHRVSANGHTVELTPKEFDLLVWLLRNRGRVVTRKEILEHVWHFTFNAPTKVVALYVHYLRKKLLRAGIPDVIETVRGVGYAVGR